jgi:hypothetical protein
MTPTEARKLQPGDRVAWNDDRVARQDQRKYVGIVTAQYPFSVSVKWDDGTAGQVDHASCMYLSRVPA